MDDNNHPSLAIKLTIVLAAVSSGAILVAIYHCLTDCWRTRRQYPSPPQPPRSFLFRQPHSLSTGIESSIVVLIPAHKYQKGRGLGGEDDAACAICLCEFEEGEELRTLPECAHTFHMPCIDMWFYSHLTCPLCRADATPSKQILLHFLDFELEESALRRDSNVSLSLSA